jgi:hypothetical protein
MEKVSKYQTNQLRDYSSLFSRSEAHSWIKMDFTSINYKILRYDKKWLYNRNSTYLDYLKYTYSILTANYQNEYIFKNEFLNKWLLAELGETDSQIFSEFRVGNSIADLVMFNGYSKIFEIKTELDSDIRLTTQIEDYKKAFNQIFLIVPKLKLGVYEKINNSIGIITYDTRTENSFSLHRSAETNLQIEPSLIMSILHTDEYKAIVGQYYNLVPPLTSFNQYKICHDLITKIPVTKLNELFIAAMKKRKSSNAMSIRYYKEFNQLFLSLKMNRDSRNKMIASLKTTIKV